MNTASAAARRAASAPWVIVGTRYSGSDNCGIRNWCIAAANVSQAWTSAIASRFLSSLGGMSFSSAPSLGRPLIRPRISERTTRSNRGLAHVHGFDPAVSDHTCRSAIAA
jgi:hypothetical protein